ncbi:MAG: NAD(P)H-dependent glycerol-3-phosphate dehydrogenase [Wenzhouxiangellaceae bacterium]|nr:NAD(P)H-dependent glycerol-3-phosphate dehydrogenase [Wenzhouxiangellaceae bacterium]
MQTRIAVLGAGSWGTALALQLARIGHLVGLWSRSPDQAQSMARDRVNVAYLPGVELPEAIRPDHRLDAVLDGSRYVLVAVPSAGFSALVERIAGQVTPATGLAWATKGFEAGSGRFLSQAAREFLPESIPLAAVSGPSFAVEVAQGLPTAVSVGASDPDFGRTWAGLLHGANFRAYYTADLLGAQLGGALKNVLAVACGMADGLGLGHNTRAALITRGLAEMMRLGQALGAEPRTLTGLAGLGDLVLTCTGDASRNRRFGLALGRGASVDEALAEVRQVVEGHAAADEAMRLAERVGVEMPICEQVHGILYRGWSAARGVRVLMERELRSEHE